MLDCIFCKIIDGDIPSHKVYEDGEMLAFHDIAPQAPVHVLFIPKIHVASAADITPENAPLIGRILEKMAFTARDLGLEDYRIVSNVGEKAGQTVFHLHFHLLGGRETPQSF
ncbi:MAG: histidine triad nucleotide-binding protein [Oscillospiraceae bacterium]|nr:histidine triad nucleotide-binding protein [Oscillospiraceae bacterium]